MIYFDAGATTLQKTVARAMYRAVGQLSSPGRGVIRPRGRRRKQTCNAAHWQQSCLAWLIRRGWCSPPALHMG